MINGQKVHGREFSDPGSHIEPLNLLSGSIEDEDENENESKGRFTEREGLAAPRQSP